MNKPEVATRPVRIAETVAIARMLLRSGREVDSAAHGGSMHPTIPSGAVIRLRQPDGASLGAGDVVAFVANNVLITHRVIALASDRHGGRFVITRGDATLACDPPVPIDAVLGIVTGVQHGEQWLPVGPQPERHRVRRWVANGLAYGVTLALKLDMRVASGLARGGRTALRLRRQFRNGLTRVASPVANRRKSWDRGGAAVSDSEAAWRR